MSFNKQNNSFSVTSSRDGSRSFKGDHDDRWSNNSSRGSRGSSRGYRGGGYRGNKRGGYRNFNASSSRFRNRGPRGEDNDGDISMSGDSSSRNQGRYNPYGSNRSRGGSRGRSSNNRRGGRGYSGPGGHQGEDSWFKIMIPFGSNLNRDELFGMIAHEIEGPFEPVKFSTDERRAYFYVKGKSMADNVHSISRRLSKPDGHKIVFHVAPSGPPPGLATDPENLEKLKLRMSDRYEPATQLLNLSALYTDEKLRKDNVFLPLNQVATMSAVTKIIGEHIPELSGLDVSKNKLLSLSHMTDLVKAAPLVVSLNLGHNKIRSVDELDKLKGWSNITELILDGNDLCNNFSNQNAYISAVRKKFPKVVKLDGQDLPPPITFDLDTDVALPPTQGSYFVNDDVKNLLVTFIKEYYSIFDSDRRKDLVPAYHDNAQFSYYVSKNPIMDRQIGFNQFMDESRNLKKIGHYDPDKLAKKIKTGVLAVVSCLENFPKTTHDFNSFTVDVGLAIPTMLSFILHGVFKESEARTDKPFIRSFSRTFVTVPCGSGMVIINDMLTISNASYEQSKNAFKSAAPTPSSSPVYSSQTPQPGPSSAVSGTSLSMSPALSPEQKTAMVQKFSTDSGMNAEFSLKCLEENAWDYQRAGQVFTDLNSQGKIPPQAFVKT